MTDRFYFSLFLYEAFATFLVEEVPRHLLRDGQGLVHQPVGQLGELLLGQREDEVVAAVAAEGERAVVLAEIFHRRQYPTLEGGAFFSIDCIENYELIRELTSFGADLVVLSPEEVRCSVIQRIEEIYQAYHV